MLTISSWTSVTDVINNINVLSHIPNAYDTKI